MKQNNHRKFKNNISKTHKDKGLQYYKETVCKKDIASPVISLHEFVKRYRRFKPNVSSLIYGGSFTPNEPHNCNGNSLYLACKLLKGELDYVEGVLRINNYLYHHGWLYSPRLGFYIDPTLIPKKGFKYYISDTLGEKDLVSLVTSEELNIPFNPAWVNENVKSMVRIRVKKKP